MSQLLSCDTFVVMPNATTNGHAIFGKNSDRPKGEVQEIVYYGRQQFQPDSKQKCTYIEVDSVPETYAVILSKPAWMFGAEMGANEFGLCIGNEAIWNKLINENDSKKKLLGMDLVRLALERAKTATEAVNVIGDLLKKYGQGGPCSNTREDFFYHNGFLIVDPQEAWVMETVASEYAAEKVDGSFRNISNCLSIGKKIDRMSENLKQLAIDHSLWDGNGEFDFAKIFTDPSKNDRDRFEAGKELLEKYTKDNNFDTKSMTELLRNKVSGICRSNTDPYPTASSQVSVISANISQRPSVHWFTGTPDPQYSYFKPFIFHPKVKLASEKTKSPTMPADDSTVDLRHVLYKRHEDFYERLQNDNELHQTLRQIECLCIDELESMLKNYYDNENEIDNLFSDSVESELRFYR